MDILELTAKELFFAASHLGAHTFFGLADPFYGMDDNEIAQETIEIKLALSEKGCASMGFDDVFAIKPETKDMISVCAGCDRYIMAELDHTGGSQERLLFYQLGEHTVELVTFEGSDRVFLRPLERTDAVAVLLNKMGLWEQEASLSVDMTASLPYATLTEACQLAQGDRSGAVSLLTDKGCGDKLADVILDGLEKKACYYSICAADMQKRELDTLVYIRAQSGLVEITVTEDDEAGELWNFSPTNGSTISNALETLFCPNP